MNQHVTDLALEHEAAPEGRLTISVGIADYLHQAGQTAVSVKDLLTEADEQLYRVKSSGRNNTAWGRPGRAEASNTRPDQAETGPDQ